MNVQLGRDTGPPEREIQEQAVLRGADDVFPAVREENWGRPGRDLQSGGKFIFVLQVAQQGSRYGLIGMATGTGKPRFSNRAPSPTRRKYQSLGSPS